MSRDDDFERWFRRKMQRTFSNEWFFQDINELLRDIEEMMNTELKEFTSRIPTDCVRENTLPNGRKIREWGPFVYGYSMIIGSDGKPTITSVVKEISGIKLRILSASVR